MILNKEEKNKIKRYIAKVLIDKFDINKLKVEKIIEESTFNRLLEEKADYVCHYSSEYWAQDIIDEINKVGDYEESFLSIM